MTLRLIPCTNTLYMAWDLRGQGAGAGAERRGQAKAKAKAKAKVLSLLSLSPSLPLSYMSHVMVWNWWGLVICNRKVRACGPRLCGFTHAHTPPLTPFYLVTHRRLQPPLPSIPFPLIDSHPSNATPKSILYFSIYSLKPRFPYPLFQSHFFSLIWNSFLIKRDQMILNL